MPVKLLRRGSSERLVEVLPLSRSVDNCALCFIVARARATGSYIIKGCGFRPKFSKRKRSAPPSSKSCLRHWKGGKCKFHPLGVCSCGKCKDPNDIKCDGNHTALE